MRPQPPQRIPLDGSDVVIKFVALPRFPDGYPTAADHSPGLIRISPGFPLLHEQDSLVHELLHEVVDRAGLSNRGDLLGRRADEENLVSRVTPWLVELMAHPDLHAYLSARRDGSV